MEALLDKNKMENLKINISYKHKNLSLYSISLEGYALKNLKK
ncbi:Uncharacterised protein [Legionella sainthelensi]|nr:Uncharacterised protein [Legionella sainthelensi]